MPSQSTYVAGRARRRRDFGGYMTSNLESPGAGSTDLERIVHYRDQAARFRQWAESETARIARDGLLDLAKQYERLAIEIETRIAARDRQSRSAAG